MNFKKLFGEEWYEALKSLLNSEYFKKLGKRVAQERRMYAIYPEKNSDSLFKAFRTTPVSKVKVIILGQDPYHDGSFDGFAFSNKNKPKLSPSLQNILKEVEDDVYDGFKLNLDPDLERWAEQGVLLINTAHSVIKGNPGSHLEYWKPFTKYVLSILANQDKPIVWMLWGRKAQNAVINIKIPDNHLVLKSSHPSPFSAQEGFFGSKPFSKANKFLGNGNMVNW